VISGFERPVGVVGDLGGGSLELVQVNGHHVGTGASVKLGGLALQDRSGGNLKAAERIVRLDLDGLPQLDAMDGQDFFAVGGTWRALGMLHQRQTGYPLNVMHGYVISAREAADFLKIVERADASTLAAVEEVSQARRPLLTYGALVLEHLIRRGKPRSVVISAQGVREGLLFEQTVESERAIDPLMAGARDYNILRSRNPAHADDLSQWMKRLFNNIGLSETQADGRIREATCLLSDIGWRAHPDYRGEQSLNVIAHAAFLGIDHPGRALIALAIFHRYAGLKETSDMANRLRTLLSPRQADRALLLAAALRVAYLISGAMPGILPRTAITLDDNRLRLNLPADLSPLWSDRVAGRLKQFGKLIGKDVVSN
jgi:exopolyphosphatase/guanosine-5'-triphosphate,3'-diphosphate pyrophosphatase